MERKRKLPARAARVSEAEKASKKRTSTPPETSRTHTPTPAAPPPPAEETLPKSITNGKPLPTVEEPQPENLSAREFQTIQESGVLVESLHRSRQKWLSEGIFQKYWTKPTKKKGAPDAPADNPAKDTMTKLGSCTITVEPHVFDATMFAIKDNTPRPPPPPQQEVRPYIQYGPRGGVMPPTPAPPPVRHNTFPPPQPPQQSPRSQDVQMSGTSFASAQHTYPQEATSGGQVPQANMRPVPPTPAAPQESGPKAQDPVIQMLAARAATDPDLRALMSIVANGEATATELKKFQGHIDYLAEVEKNRKAAEALKNAQNRPPSQAASGSQINGYNTARPLQNTTQRPTPPAPFPVPKTEPQFQPQPQALRSKGPVPNLKPDISGVVFEFAGGSGDRFLFPKHSILEYLPQGQVIASFLIVRRGSSSDSPTYDPELDYYQPITIRLYAQQGRQLEALQKVVAPQEEVQRYMNDIMDKTTRAEYVLLAMRLPKDSEPIPALERTVGIPKADHMEITSWATTTPTAHTPIAKAKPVPRLLTEEEKYQSFITTVS